MVASDEKVLRIQMKDHLRHLSLHADVNFVFHVYQGKGTEQPKHMHDIVFPAHRDQMLTASPYFESLLSGEWKRTNEISIEDCQPGAFRILLRCIYGGLLFYNSVLGSIRPSTFTAVLLAADRFAMKYLVGRLIVQAAQVLTVDLFREILDVLEHRHIECANKLNKKCRCYVDELLGVDRFFEILGIVEHRQIECARELTEMQVILCLHFMDQNAAALTKHASFLDISHERLMKILARNSINIHEIDLYRAATKWARAQLKRANKRCTDLALREVLGDGLFLIRFPIMHPQDFTAGPAKDGILSTEEKLAIYGRIHSSGPTACAFSAEPRTGPLALRHFTPTYCQACGARLSGDTCPECGCRFHASVECIVCGRRTFVDTETFAYALCVVLDCWAVAYRCSCGAPNTTKKEGAADPMCGYVAKTAISEELCKCDVCLEKYPEDYSDDELTPSED